MMLALVLLTSCAVGVPVQDVPANADAALRKLRQSQAPGSEWSRFGVDSSVRYKKRGKSPAVGEYEETFTQIITGRTDAAIQMDVVLDATQERFRWLSARLDAPELDAAQAKLLGEDDVLVGKRKFRVKVYEFVVTVDLEMTSTGRNQKITTHTYWLSGGVPDGVLRHHEVSKMTKDKSYNEESDMKLVDLDVEVAAGGKKFSCYVIETESGERGGKLEKSRLYRSADVPGQIVKGETKLTEGGKETGWVTQEVLEFKVTRP